MASWSPPPWTTKGEAGPDQRTPDITPVIQEIVNRPGWASGNSLALIITGAGKRTAKSYNGDQAGAPLLHVEYTTRPPNDPPVANPDSASTTEAISAAIDKGIDANVIADIDGELRSGATVDLKGWDGANVPSVEVDSPAQLFDIFLPLVSGEGEQESIVAVNQPDQIGPATEVEDDDNPPQDERMIFLPVTLAQ